MQASCPKALAIAAALAWLPAAGSALSTPVTYVFDSGTLSLEATTLFTPQIEYAGNAEEFGWILPLPSVPTIVIDESALVVLSFSLPPLGAGPGTLSTSPTGPPTGVFGIVTVEFAEVTVTSGAGFSSIVSGGPDVFDLASMGPFEVAGSLSTNGGPFVPYATLLTSDTTGQLVLDSDGSIEFTLNDITLAEIIDPGGSGDFVRITGNFVLHGVPVPEPGVLALLAVGLGLLAVSRRGLR